MKDSIFLLSDLEPTDLLNTFSGNIGIIVLAILVLFLTDKSLSIFEKAWDIISEKIYNPTSNAADPFGDFTGLDQSVISVVDDTGVKFEDVAGNEEAKAELKEVVKFLIV
jgi:ATP-dependent Zn protease